MKRAAVALLGSTALAVAGPADWAPTRSAFDPDVIARYEQLLEANPFDDLALARLDALYAGRTKELEARFATMADRNGPAGTIAGARLRQRHRDLRGARALFTQVTDAGYRVWLALAQLDRDAGDPKAERADYDHVLASDTPPAVHVQAVKWLAERMVLERDPHADAMFDQWIAIDPENAQVWIERGDYLLDHDSVGAIAAYAHAETLVKDPAQRLVAIERYGDALAKAKQFAGAVATFERALAIAPRDYYIVTELYGRMVDAAREGQLLPTLATDLDASWPERHRDAAQWTTLAHIYRGIKDPHRAQVALEHATALAPWDLPAQRELISIYEAAGDRAAVRMQLRAAIRAAPGEAELQLSLAEHLTDLQTSAWIDELAHIAAQWPNDLSVLDGIASMFLHHGKPVLATKYLERIARLEPDEPDHWLALASAYIAANDIPGAVKAWKRVAKQMPGAMLRFADLLTGSDAQDEALELIDASIKIDALNPEAWRLRSLAHDADGMHDAAINDAIRALELTAPDREMLRRARHQLATLIDATRLTADDQLDYESPWATYQQKWHDEFWATTPNVESGYLYVEMLSLHECDQFFSSSCTDVMHSVQRLEHLVPDDPGPLHTEIRILRAMRLPLATADRLRRLAKLEPQNSDKLLMEAVALDDRIGREIRVDVRTEPDIEVGDRWPIAHERCQWDACGHDLHAGLFTNVGTALRGDAIAPGIAVGGFIGYDVIRTFPTVVTVELRGEVEQRDTTAGALTLFGWYATELPSHNMVRIGGGVRGEFADPFGIGLDAGLAFGLTDVPIDVGARFEQYIVGTTDTRGLLELRVRLF
ncbi:MAG: hypothetical protein QM831_41590 [Kofleriaceae bacterium]